MTDNASRFLLAFAIAGASVGMAGAAPLSAAAAGIDANIPAWTPTQGHARPLVAVVGDNAGTELTDFVIPYGVFKRAGIDTVALAVHAGPFRFRPALKAQLDATVAEFDAEHPEGADYVVVPAVTNVGDPALLAWIAAQSRKGATVVGICDGTLVVARAGLLEGKWATAHWASESQRLQHFPNTHWLRNVRYVVDGKFVTSSGISAAMPTSIALVEAIDGHDRASALAAELGVADWSPRHDSDAFRPHYGNLKTFAVRFGFNPLRGGELVGIPLSQGVDEIALAVTADAYSRTGRSQAVSIAQGQGPVASRGGLEFLPDVVGDAGDFDLVLPPPSTDAPAHAFDTALAGIASRYGRKTAHAVAIDFEYPNFIP
jgi:putative intracellular protease/amidase